jgi:rubrerythrin
MKYFTLKFNYAVEIGARLAYLGHFKRTYDPAILKIADEEEDHRLVLESVLRFYGQKPSKILNKIFWAIGTTVGLACKIFPIWSLNLVARSMEVFAVFSYERLAKAHPKFDRLFSKMALAEKRHETYFKEIA